MLSAITQRRLANLRKNKRGYYSLWIFGILFGCSLCAELVINSQPLLVSYEGEFYYPIIKKYSEKTFGGDFETETDYLDPYIQEKINSAGWILFPPVRYYYDTIITNLNTPAPSPPSQQNWLGTDDQARDVFARVVYGFRLSTVFGLALTIISMVIGVSAGGIQGYFGGWIDLFFQRFIEVWESIPTLYLLIILSSVIIPSFAWFLLLLSLFSWIGYTGVVRAEFLRIRNLDYVRSAKAMGLSHITIMFRHVLPNAMIATITFLPFNLAAAITTLAALDFLGFGLPPPTPSLGEMIYQGKNNLSAPWLGLTGFFVLAIMLSLLMFAGEAIRDAFDYQKTFKSSKPDDSSTESSASSVVKS
ncbi:inner membrane ABC transporter permease protein YejE [Spirochaetota bacterium]|nr:inner membrane ABC transporter permease protein YejE [Spirochaetota bacterium]